MSSVDHVDNEEILRELEEEAINWADDPLNPEAPEGVLVGYLGGLVRESIQSRRKYMSAAAMDNNLRLYLGDQIDFEPLDNLQVFVANKIQNLVIAAAAVQTEQEPSIKLRPRETGDPPIVFFKPETARKVAEAIEKGRLVLPVELDDEQLQGLASFDHETYLDLLSLPQVVEQETIGPDGVPTTTQAPEVDPQTGREVKMFSDEDFILINDQTVAEAEQTVFDVHWSRAHGPLIIRSNILNTNVVGLGPVKLEYDPRYLRFDLENINPKRFYPDPRYELYQQWGHELYDEVISKAEALHRYGRDARVRAAILSSASRGNIVSLANDAEDWGELDTEIQYEREMVVVRHAWLRYQPYPAELDEALRYGWVDEVKDEAGNVSYVLDDGSPTSPGAPNWPETTNGIRYICVVAGRKVRDERSKFVDLSIPTNKCKPIPGRPWAQGMPEIVEPVQRAINMMLSNFVNHSGYYASPMEAMSESMRDAIEDQDGESLGASPGRCVIVPDEVYRDNAGRISTFIDPPPIPESLVKFYLQLIDLFEDLGARPAAIRGEADPNAKSGRAIMALQSAARGVFGYLAMQTQDLIRDLARLMLPAMRDYLPESEWMRCTSKYPIQVLRAIRARAKNLEYDVEVEVAAAAGLTRIQEEEQARLDYQAGLRSRQSTMEKIGVADAKQELQMLREELQLMAQPAA